MAPVPMSSATEGPGVGLSTWFYLGDCSLLATKQIDEPRPSILASVPGLSRTRRKFCSEKTSVMVPLEERHPLLVQATHICGLHEERSLLEWSHSLRRRSKGRLAHGILHPAVLMDNLSPDRPVFS